MSMTVTLDGITLALAPDLRLSSDEGSRLVETVSGGALLWRGSRRQAIHLRGQGLSTSERDHLESIAASQATVALLLGAESWDIVLTKIVRGPTTGSDRWTVDLEALVVSVISE